MSSKLKETKYEEASGGHTAGGQRRDRIIYSDADIDPDDGVEVRKKDTGEPVPVIIMITRHFRRDGDNLVLSGMGLAKVHNVKSWASGNITAEVSGVAYPVDLGNGGISIAKGFRMVRFAMTFPIEDLLVADMQNRINILYKGEHEGFLYFNALDGHIGRKYFSRTFSERGKTMFLRQSNANLTHITIREDCYYDTPAGRRDILIGRIWSKLMIGKDIIFLYEKECEKYEESASILFERLVDAGYKNAYFILDRNSHMYDRVNSKYRSQIVDKHSLRHVAYFFRARTFIGTETIPHAMQLRAANTAIARKNVSDKIDYAFLQHGVMYMVSLNSDLRTGFKKHRYRKHRVVVSSEAEAQHFIDLAGFDREDMYVCGLPKLDTAYRYDDADRIIIMPTWRRWEVNEMTVDYAATGYVGMISRMVSAVPDDLADRIVVLPHPLMLEAVRESGIDSRYIPEGDLVYDEILRSCRMLITDYSSISYDAFYRGANVIFYWEDLAECMEHYGDEAYLLLNDDNAFGDVCYNMDELSGVIRRNYDGSQTEEHIGKYRKIVTYHDGRNTDRLIEMLQRDGFI